MMSEEYRKRGMDLKRLYLCLQGRIWLLVMLAVTGAVLGGVTYQVVRAMRMPVTYAGVSKLYISFGVDESGEVYQYYNGYTWNDLLDTNPVLDKIMKYIPDGYSREDVIGATRAEILSDIRLLTITVEGSTEKFVREIQKAVEEGLVEYARASEELKRIEVIRTDEPVHVFWDDRTMTACVAGGVIFAVAACIVLAFIYVLDESVYVQSDLEKKYPYKILGIMPRKQKGLQPYARELQANFSYLLGNRKKFAAIDVGDHCDVRGMELELVLNAEENEFVGGDGEAGGLTWTLPKDPNQKRTGEEWEVHPFNQSTLSQKELERIRELGGAVLLLPFGEDMSRKTARVLGLLKNQDCQVLGMVISQADEDFLNRYYN